MKEVLTTYAGLFKEVMQIDPFLASMQKPLRDVEVSEDEYFEHLYVERKVTKQVKEKILKFQNELICLVGPRGSGKSTIAKKIRRDFSSTDGSGQKDSSVFFTLYDVRYRNINDYLGKEKKLRRHLRDLLEGFFLDELGDEIGILEHLAFFLDSDIPEADRPKDLFAIFSKIIGDVSIQMAEYRFELRQELKQIEAEDRWDHRIQEREIWEMRNRLEHLTVYKWLQYLREKGKQKYLRKLYKKVFKKASLLHLAFAHRYLFQKKFVEEGREVAQIFWFDNIDALHAEDQRMLVNVLHSFQRELHEIVTIVIAAREENVFQESHDYDAGAPTFRSVIFIDDPHKFDIQSVKGINLGHLVSDEIQKIVEKRLDYFPAYVKKVDPWQELDEEAVAVFQRVVKEVVAEVFEAEKFLYVANNSLRELLPMYADFAFFLIQKIGWMKEQRESVGNRQKRKSKPESVPPPCLTDPYPFRVMEALYWLAYEENYFDFYNLVEYCKNPYLNGSCENGSTPCFLPHVVLTAIWNMMEQKREGVHRAAFINPKIKRVVERLEKLGFEEGDVKKVLLKLYRPQEGRSHFIVIETKRTIRQPEDIDKDFRARITSRGQVALNRIFNSFGYFYGMIKRFEEKPIYTTPSNRVQDGHLFLNYVKEMYLLHLKALKSIRDNAYGGRSTWYDEYLQEFGIYVDPSVSRKMKPSSAYRIGARTYILYFPYLIESVLPYFNYVQSRDVYKKLETLLGRFMQYVNGLREGESFEAFELP